ncbi:MAG TPA: DUF1592 domain-containing protein [Chthoniobacteraceae bacterium]|jgi:hypothetical protein
MLSAWGGALFADGPPAFIEGDRPFLEQYCFKCHGKEKQKAGLALDGFQDDLSVLRARKRWKRVIEKVQAEDMPPDDETQPTAEERRKFLAGASGLFLWADQAPLDPGRLPLRRLNRADYNNTIRDLLKVEFRPGDDFPADEVGNGFDNIADVLTVSPLLMERYLDAADRIAELAIPLNPAKPPVRTMAGKYLEPASPYVPQDRFRPVCAAKTDAVFTGPLHTPARIAPDGDYVMRTRLYARSANGAPVRIALLVTGPKISNPSPAAEVAKLDGIAMRALTPCVILKTVEVTAKDEASAQLFEVKIPHLAGIERIALAAFKPVHGEAPPELFVEYLQYEGPLDARSPATKSLMVFTPGKSQREQAAEVLSRLATRAWRRPVEAEELDRLMHLVDYAMGHGDNWEEGVRRAVSAILASPKFVFRLEPDPTPNDLAAHPITEPQLATRLSYFLWSSCPDDELEKLAGEGKLSANLRPQIQRMLHDPRSEALIENFALQWLQLGRLATHSADAETFTRWKPALRAAMLEETRRFVREIIDDDRSVVDFLDGDFTWVNRALAELYGVKPPGGIRSDEWKRISLDGTQRGGLLTQASVLTVTSNPTRTSPVKRGKWILEQILGTPPPPPLPNVGSLDDSQRKELSGTFRHKLEQHRANPQCASCHEKMDAFGFTLENFDAIGEWRARDETGAPVDAKAKVSSNCELDGVSGLEKYLRDRKADFVRCLTEKMLTYALGRGLDYYDDPTVERIQRALAAKGDKFSALVTEIVESPAFRMRRGAGQMAN